MKEVELGRDGEMKWLRVDPPYWWPPAKCYVIGDRHLSDGTRQHLVTDSVKPGTVINNAEVISQERLATIEYLA